MLGIIGLIFKIIIWIILGIIGLILLLLLMILFVPIRYKIEASKYEQIIANIEVSYLLKLLRVKIRYNEDGLYYVVKVLFFTIKISEQSDSDGEKPRSDDEARSTKMINKTATEGSKSDLEPIKNQSLKQDKVEVKVETKRQLDSNQVEKIDGSQSDKKPETKKVIEQKKPVIAVKGETKAKKNKKVHKKQKKEEPKEESTLDKVKRFIRFLRTDKNKGILKFVLKMIFRMLKSIFPRKIKGKALFGLDDPSKTGMLLGQFYMFYPLYSKHFFITPDFEGTRFEGEIKAEGKVVLGVIVYYGLRIIIDKRVRRLIKEVKK